MGDRFFAACNTVPEIDGTEVRFSIKTCEIVPLRDWPIRLVKADTIIPNECRIQWGVPTCGPRLDSYKGLRLGDEKYNLELGMRSTNAGGHLMSVEEQRVGVATLTLDGKYKLKYWNDHYFPFWPMGGGTDQGDTAGVQFSYNLGNRGFPVGSGWQFETVSLTLRLATGIPDKSSVQTIDGRTIYSRVAFDGIRHGDLDLNTTLSKKDTQRLSVGLVINSEKIRDATQNKLIHRNLKIPELPATNDFGAIIYFKLEGF